MLLYVVPSLAPFINLADNIIDYLVKPDAIKYENYYMEPILLYVSDLLLGLAFLFIGLWIKGWED